VESGWDPATLKSFALGRGSTKKQAYERASMDLRSIQGLISVQIEKLADYTITAPIDGVVLRRDGEVADAGQILFGIGVLKPLQLVKLLVPLCFRSLC
jgi:hypothetical protein